MVGKQYRIIFGGTYIELEQKVNKLLNEDWDLQGGVSFADSSWNTGYYQAMFKYHKKGKKDE